MIDIIVLAIITFFFFIGSHKGFCLYLWELAITAVSLVMSWLYYQQNQMFFKSILVFVWVFLGLSILKWFILRNKRKKGVSEASHPHFANWCGGGILGLIWGVLMATLVILALDLLPIDAVLGYNLKEKVQQSRSYQVICRVISTKEIPLLENIGYLSEVARDKNAQIRLAEQPELKAVIEHQSFKAVIEDPELVAQLENKDLVSLLKNPKIRNLLNDGEFLEKLMKLDFKKAVEE